MYAYQPSSDPTPSRSSWFQSGGSSDIKSARSPACTLSPGQCGAGRKTLFPSRITRTCRLESTSVQTICQPHGAWHRWFHNTDESCTNLCCEPNCCSLQPGKYHALSCQNQLPDAPKVNEPNSPQKPLRVTTAYINQPAQRKRGWGHPLRGRSHEKGDS